MPPMDIAGRQRFLYRDTERGVIAGVCAGLAERLDVDPLLLRAAFVAATAAGGVGALAYGLAWLLIPAGTTGRAHVDRLRARPGSGRTAAGVALLTLSALLVLRQLGIWFSDAIVWPVVLAAAGVALFWRLSTPGVDEATIEGNLEEEGSVGSRRATTGLYRGGFGVALIVGAALLFLYANGLLAGLGDLVLTAVVVTVALALLLAPFWWRLLRSLTAERAARIRSQERAEVAAHLHDSVLQTLALVQRRAHDPRAVTALARRQERELRAWLQGSPLPSAKESVAGALAASAVEVEEEHEASVELVAVGDAPLDDHTRAVVAAAREALVNAAKFAGEEPISVYVESGPERLQVFIRDRGSGFDPDALPRDRHGVRESIIGRMARHGGRAAVRAAPGRGTEIELILERPR
jgi:signal transduction histidine kinase/phage shock protein PspC (stress-responsive transcriptional regulator)